MGKDIPVFACFVIATILAIAACPTRWYEVDGSDTGATLWKSCASGTCVDLKSTNTQCSDQWKTAQAGRAFEILTVIFFAVCAILAALRWQMLTVAVLMKAGLKIPYFIVAILGLISAILTWILLFALFSAELCTGVAKVSSNSGYKVGPSGPLMFTASIIFLVGLILECVMDDDMPDVSLGGGDSSDNAPDAVKSDDNKKVDDSLDTEDPEKKKAEEKARAEDAEIQAAKKKEQDDAAAGTGAAAAVAVVAVAATSGDKKKKEKKNIDWKSINAKLPYEKKNAAQKEKRFAMFAEIDTNSTGQVTLAEATVGMEKVLNLGKELDVPVVIKTAFATAAAGGQTTGEGTGSSDFIEKNEFRLFLMYIRIYFEMYQLFEELDESGDMQVDAKEFKQAMPTLATWGAKITDPDAEFKKIDKSGGGSLDFQEFVVWALAQNLDSPDEDGN